MDVTKSARSARPVKTPDAPKKSETREGPPHVTIGQIQGRGIKSSWEGKRVTTAGYVSGVRNQGYFIQADKSEKAAGSRGLWIYTGDKPEVAVGDKVTVSGDVIEYRNERALNALTTTELGGRITTFIKKSGLDLATEAGTPRLVGKDGFKPPHTKATDGIKFWERFEGERICLHDLLVVEPTSFGKFMAVVDFGAGATRLTPRNTLIAANSDADAQPEAIAVKLGSGATPQLKVGDRIPGEVFGHVIYSNERYVLEAEALPPAEVSAMATFKSELKPSDTHMLIASVNCENLDPTDGVKRFEHLAKKLLKTYNTPDVVALQEVQDNDGAKNSGTTSGRKTGKMLTDAIKRAGGPEYRYIEVAPENNQAGGEHGGNIRCAFLVREDRVEVDDDSIRLIGDDDVDFKDTRKSLEMRVTLKASGETVTLINNHFTSKRGSASPYGEKQPPVDTTVKKRKAQNHAVHKRMIEIGRDNPKMRVVALGDSNETPLETVRATPASIRSMVQNVTYKQAWDEARSYIFGANAQSIDQVQVLRGTRVQVDYDDTNPRLPDRHPDRDSDHGHILVLVDMHRPRSAKKMRAA